MREDALPDKEPKKKKPSRTLEQETPGKEKRRLHAYFSGTVQGVGFRYAASSVAERFAVNGWVRNCSEGRVELVAEGSADELERYLGAIGDEMSGYIRSVERTWVAATGEFSSFTIASSAG